MTTSGKWGLYPWFEEDGAHLVHRDDLDAFRKLMPYGKVFYCEHENEYLSLRYRDATYRVKPELFREVSTPQFTFGQIVFPRDTGAAAQIDGINWHHERGEPMFFVIQNGKRKSRRFWTADLAPTAE